MADFEKLLGVGTRIYNGKIKETKDKDGKVIANDEMALKKLVNEGYTIVSISHKLEFLKYADIIYTISDGEITKVEVNSNGSN